MKIVEVYTCWVYLVLVDCVEIVGDCLLRLWEIVWLSVVVISGG